MFKAVFIDIDGTLIKSDHSVSEATISTIKKLTDKNILVALVSARPLHGIMPIAEKVGLENAPISSLNGGYIYSNNEIVFDSFIDTDTTARLDQQLKAYDTTVIYYERQQWFAEVQNSLTDREQKITEIPITIQPFETTLEHWKSTKSGPNKILVIAEPNVVEAIQHDLKLLYANELNMYPSKPIYLEMMNKNASKTNAIKFLMARYNILQAETIAIGDNFNDKEMIEFAGTGIAMGNAPDEIKEVADYVTDTNNNDGVHKALVKFFNL